MAQPLHKGLIYSVKQVRDYRLECNMDTMVGFGSCPCLNQPPVDSLRPSIGVVQMQS